MTLVSLLMAPVAAAETNNETRSGAEYDDDWDDDDRHWHEDPKPATGDGAERDPCGEIWADFEANVREMEERHEAEWRAHDAEWDAHNADENRTPEEDKAFAERMEREEREMHQRHQEEFRTLQRQAEDACDARLDDERAARGQTAEHADDPCRDLWAQHEQRWEEVDRRHREEWRALEDERHAFYSGNHTREEAEAFEERMRQKEQAMQERHDQERKELEKGPESECRERHREEMRKERARHMEEERARRAQEYREMDPEMQAAMRAMDELRFECEERAMEREDAFHERMEAKFRAFEESGGSDHAAFEREMEKEHRAFEREMNALWRECEQKMRAYYEEHIGHHMKEGDDYERMGSWNMEESDGKIFLHGKYMSLSGDPSTNTIGDIAIAGQVYIQHVDSTGAFRDFMMDEHDGGSTLTAMGEGLRMRLHDNPAGVINFQAKGETLVLKLPPTFEVEQTESGWAWTNGDHHASLRASGATYDEEAHELHVTGQATFLLPGEADNQVLKKVANKHRGEIMDAVESKQLGAEITVAGSAEKGALDDTVVYDDVDVQVETPADESEPVAITVSADASEEGKTFVLNLDQDLYDLGADLAVTYFDIDEETGEETPAEIQKASSIKDVLDATDDDTAEYWIVLDEDGFQVLVSVPSWSTHRFKVHASEGGDAEEPFHGIPAPSLALVALAAVGAAAVVGRRRD